VAINTGAGAGNILFSSTLDATAAGIQALELTAGTGNIGFAGIVGDTRLGAVTINEAANVTVGTTATDTFSAASFEQAAAGTGTFKLNAALDTNAGVVTINSKTVDLDAGITTTAGSDDTTDLGAVTMTAGIGGVDLADGKTITTTAADAGTNSGAIDINSEGSVNLEGNLVTTGLAGDSTTTAGASGGAVAITTTDSAATITLSDITTSGGAAASSSNDNGGDAGTITLTTHAKGMITLDDSTITAAGGAGDGTGLQGAGATIEFANAVELATANAS